MSSNPYLDAWRLRRRHERETEGAGALARLVVPLVAAVLLVPLARPVFLSFLQLEPSVWPEGAEAVSLRAALAVVGVLALDVYSALVRGSDRAVLDLHPVDPAAVARYAIVRVAWERAWLVPLFAAVLAPIALQGAPLLWALAVAVVVGAFAVGLSASAMVHLLAVDIAESPRWANLLDLVRGANPRAQAAFLWAPGVVLLGAGVVVGVAAHGVRMAGEGAYAGAGLLLLPFVAAAAAWAPVAGLADRAWFRASAVLADIDARYATLEGREEGLRVYLDWAVRFLPATVALYALKDLRHGWRARRTWITGAWLAGIGAALVGWSSDPASAGRAAAAAGAAVWGVAAVGVFLDRDDPPFLRAFLPPTGPTGLAGRAFALFAWLQACWWPATLAVAVRHGARPALLVLAVAALASALAVPLATACGTRERGAWLYAPIAAVAAVATAAVLLGGT